jgi:hypothetical protein
MKSLPSGQAGTVGPESRANENAMQKTVNTERNIDPRPPPRARCILEFVEGDVERPPAVYPLGGSDEVDTAMVTAIMERWEGSPA